MKTFKQIKEESQNLVNLRKINGYPVSFTPISNGMIKVSIDGEELDTYPSEAEALNMAKEFIRQYKGK